MDKLPKRPDFEAIRKHIDEIGSTPYAVTLLQVVGYAEALERQLDCIIANGRATMHDLDLVLDREWRKW